MITTIAEMYFPMAVVIKQCMKKERQEIMNTSEVLKIVDHTLLTQTATWEDIKTILDDGIKYETASACIPAAYVKQADEYVEGKLPICTVIGFPNGYSTTATKVFETKDAIANGASEIDMVINIGFLKDGRYDEVEEEIRQIHEACDGKILKVIIETCLLTEEEKIKMCEIVTKAGAEFIKTSTGFSTAGATFEDVKLMHDHVGEGVKVKAAGGISSFDDAEKFMSLGADRLGTSRLVKIMKNTDNGAGYEFFVCIRHCNSSPLWYLVLSCRNRRTDRMGRLCRMHYLLCLWQTWHEWGEEDRYYESYRCTVWNDDHHT